MDDSQTALPTAPPMVDQSDTIAVTIATSACVTDAWAAVPMATDSSPPPMPWRICVQMSATSEPCAPQA